MAKMPHPYLSSLVIIFVISSLMSIIGVKQRPWTDYLPSNLFSLDIATRLRDDEPSLAMASADFGNLVHTKPAALLYPSSMKDIVTLVQFSYNISHPFKIAVRGRGHSCRGQAMVENGVVIDMASLRNYHNNPSYHKENHNNINSSNNFKNYDENGGIRVSYDSSKGYYYADAGGEQLWIDVLRATLEHGVAPFSWTDYLYLSVGGTLSNAGISGQSFRYGPQISNVFELDVVIGKGELVTCSRKINKELFYAVLGGLGQFGIITRARIALGAAPKRVKWVRMLYNHFTTFTRDQEFLISMNGDKGSNSLDSLNYVEGIVIMNQANPNNWRSSFFSVTDQEKVASLRTPNGIIYCLEVAMYYYQDHDDANIHDKELESNLRGLNFVPGFIFKRDVSFVEFLNRVRKGELKLQSQGLWDVPHPWLNIFIPRSRINDFSQVFPNIVVKHKKALGTTVLIYPLNSSKWDDKMSAVTVEEKVFYTVGFLHSGGFDDWEDMEDLNKEILKFCEEDGIKIKQYLPHYSTKEEWQSHFGSKWKIFQERKALFDPKMILSPGQKIFY